MISDCFGIGFFINSPTGTACAASGEKSAAMKTIPLIIPAGSLVHGLCPRSMLRRNNRGRQFSRDRFEFLGQSLKRSSRISSTLQLTAPSRQNRRIAAPLICELAAIVAPSARSDRPAPQSSHRAPRYRSAAGRDRLMACCPISSPSRLCLTRSCTRSQAAQ